MEAKEFRAYYFSLFPPIPPDLDLEDFGEFFKFNPELILRLNISQADKDLLIESGLPRSASPFLSFGLTNDILLTAMEEAPSCRPIGQTGYGDLICIDESEQGAIVYLNHDRDMERVFMNSSVRSLAHSLCGYLEFRQTRDIDKFRKLIADYDRKAMSDRSFWSDELRIDTN